MASWLTYLRHRNLLVRSALLVSCVAMVYALAVPLVGHYGGPQGLIVAAAAAIVCLAGAELALLAVHALRGPRRVLWGAFLGMLFRTGIPLGFALACFLSDSPLTRGGVLYLVAFYLFTLSVETALSVPVADQSPQRPNVSHRVGS